MVKYHIHRRSGISYNSVTNGSQVAYWSTLWHVTSDNLANPHMSGSDFFSHNTPGLIKTEDGGKTLKKKSLKQFYISLVIGFSNKI